ncbi:FMN-dependent NADH-azoreductase [Rickettsiales endosymbiont of Stachyamoeba lipophora]|uniref:FMN-dependent NADH-azoreductase n=1 Tax=Rickettsiales endosymbiont of Stachyamoeba lipophora TaxID=2486578 RepID=UPI000F649EB5|nr:NAD(P)H-dependent oxidoreductase [Rickettsiales endosymbiont of Stachyamoeba lipophora]AZL16293.1 hypothetical protein EF513_07120 [Rickettsiales endosymbiont of Stachyamoeba lipophora]
MKILVVKYLPNGEKSNTKILLDHFKSIVNTHQIEELDLLENQPPIFNELSLQAYALRNYMGQKLTEAQQQAIEPFDKLVAQLVACDILIIATPMHNYSFPGIVKTYFDAVMLHNETFRMGGPQDNGKKYVGLLTNRKALTIFTSGGFYPEDSEFYYLNNIATLSKIAYNMVGFEDFKTVYAATANPETLHNNMEKAQKELEQIAASWKLN